MRPTLLTIYLCLQYYQTIVVSSYHERNTNYLKSGSDNNFYQKSSSNKISARTLIGNNNNNNFRVRHSRFPNLEKLKNRLENMGDRKNSDVKFPKIRHYGWNVRSQSTTTTSTQSPLFDTYGDLEENEEYDDKLEDDEEYDDDSNTEEPFFDHLDDNNEEYDDFQAEEPTESLTPAPRPVSKFTQYKFEHYGSMKSVQESRRNHLNLHASSEEVRLNAARDHFFRVNKDGVCRRPLPKVISVQIEHPDTTLTYVPHCTVLHRCAHDTGCCRHDTTCSFKTREVVYLYIYAQRVGTTKTTIKKLPFYNHTECECQKKSLNTTVNQVPIIELSTPSDEPQQQSTVDSTLSSSTSINELAYRSGSRIPFRPFESVEIRCKCPGEFKSFRIGTKCVCDCEDDNDDCKRMKDGKEYIGLTDRLCILNSKCGTPKCEHGTYVREKGRCPKKLEKSRSNN